MTRRLLPLALTLPLLAGCDPQGLDLYSPTDARDYVRSCARARSDVMCRAMQPTLATVSGPVSVLLPNTGDTEREEALTRFLAGRGTTLAAFRSDAALQAAFARANIFPVAQLRTGTFRTLDGTPHEVTCADQSSGLGPDCQIGRLGGVDHLHYRKPQADSLYATSPKTAGQLIFFPF
ncbi:hypothetical protein [Deinococcus soli (ex Cha et al. 2016)]|uniref:hypothetical protein n=1 Tax=Deinococcus soli (ex Cha et al. 2016) TaxID=1309411 RepID=UPI00166B31D4|nr:hypothetical protein [Deinococcus soli (ex Cha et al. 2016)]GGB56994.1 hypothetical protein GCM10008019_11060 [Deinococcus soli (ex Cha et al. 2016)]